MLRSSADENGLVALEEDETEEFKRLAVFLTTVSANPQHFPITGRMARSIKKRTLASRLPKPGAGDSSRSVRNKRKARQEKRRAFHKDRRKHRREQAENFNQAREQYERDVAEMQAIQEQRQAEIALEPKFDVTDIMGNVVIEGVPQSMIRPQVELGSAELAELATISDPALRGKVILPGSAEHLGVDLDN